MLSPTLLVLLLLPMLVSLYFAWTFLMLVLRQARSPLRHLPGPPSPSFFMGNLREMHDQENTALVPRWAARYGTAFVYRGFIGGCRLMTTDPRAVNYIMSRGYDYPKPDFVRDSLASMAAGYEGLLTAEGDMHRKQVRPLFSLYALSARADPPVFVRMFTAEDFGECFVYNFGRSPHSSFPHMERMPVFSDLRHKRRHRDSSPLSTHRL